MPINSPCIGLCTLDEKEKICVGCFRNLDEIIDWTGFSEDEKFSVLERCIKRRKEHAAKTPDQPTS